MTEKIPGYRTRKRLAIKRAVAAGKTPEDWKHYMPVVGTDKRRKQPPPALDPNTLTVAALEEQRNKDAQQARERRARVQRMDEAIRIGLARRAGITPLEFLLSCLRDPNVRFAFKLDAAKAAAPYMHKRMPIAIQATTEGGRIDLSSAALHRLSSDELNTLCALLVKAGVGEPEFIGPEPATYGAFSPPSPDGSTSTEPFALRVPHTLPQGVQTREPKTYDVSDPRTSQGDAGKSQSDPLDVQISSTGVLNPLTPQEVRELENTAAVGPEIVNTEQALRAAYEAGAISDFDSPLRLPHTYSPDSMDPRSIDDQGTEPAFDFGTITLDGPDLDEDAEIPPEDSGTIEYVAGPRRPGRGPGVAPGRRPGNGQLRGHGANGGAATAKRKRADRDVAGAGRKGKSKRKS